MPFSKPQLAGMLDEELRRATERIDRAIDDLKKDRGDIQHEGKGI
jgi:hypothetical protein